MKEIIPGLLFVGNVRDARNISAVLSFEIAAVVDLAAEEAPIVFPRDVVYCRFPISDSGGNKTAFLQGAIDSIANLLREQVPTLIACSAGMSRSPSIAAAAISTVEGLTLDDALNMVSRFGPCDVHPMLWKEIQGVCST
ncbi:MAG: hypothetical protein Tsb009_23340 [Planctomycetaceae bacterium]